MKLISSKKTFLSKKVLPILLFGILMIITGGAILNGTSWKNPAFLFSVAFATVVLFFITYFLLWELADEVFDDGDYLVVKRGSQVERIPLANVMNVNVSTNTKQLQITLRLLIPGKFGTRVTFLPETWFSLNPFAKNPIVEELIVRVHRAGTKRVA